jgi:putative FmdB family regulatory protein
VPTYDYQCAACGCTFERRQRFDDEPVAACPKCAAKSRRLFHSVPIFFKGSGFYSTDSGRTLRGNHSRNDGESSEKPDVPSDVKPQPKSESQGKSPAEAKAASEGPD